MYQLYKANRKDLLLSYLPQFIFGFLAGNMGNGSGFASTLIVCAAAVIFTPSMIRYRNSLFKGEKRPPFLKKDFFVPQEMIALGLLGFIEFVFGFLLGLMLAVIGGSSLVMNASSINYNQNVMMSDPTTFPTILLMLILLCVAFLFIQARFGYTRHFIVLGAIDSPITALKYSWNLTKRKDANIWKETLQYFLTLVLLAACFGFIMMMAFSSVLMGAAANASGLIGISVLLLPILLFLFVYLFMVNTITYDLSVSSKYATFGDFSEHVPLEADRGFEESAVSPSE